jgi:hypothetical protein
MTSDPGASSWLADNPLVPALLVVALGAFAFALVSLAMAWRKSAAHPPFQALGFRKWVIGNAVFQHMPPEANRYLKRWLSSLIVFILALVGAIAALWIGAARAGQGMPVK